jgi:lipoyl(octanoyl) transferase
MNIRITPPSHITFFAEAGYPPVEWRVFEGLQPYAETLAAMEAHAEAVSQGLAPEAIWLLEHPPLYTAGTSANPADLVEPDRLPVHQTGRGGQYTYHGPGQRVAYVILDLKRRRQDVRAFVCALEAWLINTLAEFNVKGERRADRVGVWVTRPKWVSFHGIALNVELDLAHFSGIVPCGIQGYGVTSLVDLGLPVTMDDVDVALKRAFVPVFGGV